MSDKSVYIIKTWKKTNKREFYYLCDTIFRTTIKHHTRRPPWPVGLRMRVKASWIFGKDFDIDMNVCFKSERVYIYEFLVRFELYV